MFHNSKNSKNGVLTEESKKAESPDVSESDNTVDHSTIALEMLNTNGYLTSPKDIVNVGLTSKANYVTMLSRYQDLCRTELGFTPTKQSVEAYFRVKKIIKREWPNDPRKKQKELDNYLNFLKKYSTSGAHYYAALVQLERHDNKALVLELRAAVDLNEAPHSVTAAHMLGEIYFYASMQVGVRDGVLHLNELDVKDPLFQEAQKNLKHAQHYLHYAASRGDSQAKTFLAKIFLTTHAYHPHKAEEYLTEVADKDPEAAFMLYQFYQHGLSSNEFKHGKLMQDLTDQKSPEGFVYSKEGILRVEANLSKAQTYLLKAAAKNHLQALEEVGLAFRDGTLPGIMADAALAEKYLLEAAKLGSRSAKNELIHSYRYGKGEIKADRKKLESFLHQTLKTNFSTPLFELFAGTVVRNQHIRAVQLATFTIPVINFTYRSDILSMVFFNLLSLKSSIKYREHILVRKGLRDLPKTENKEDGLKKLFPKK